MRTLFSESRTTIPIVFCVYCRLLAISQGGLVQEERRSGQPSYAEQRQLVLQIGGVAVGASLQRHQDCIGQVLHCSCYAHSHVRLLPELSAAVPAHALCLSMT